DTNLPIVGRRFLCFCFFFVVAVWKRNEVPPRTVANSDKENSQNRPATDAESGNPAPTPTASPEPPAPDRPFVLAQLFIQHIYVRQHSFDTAIIEEGEQ
ncbi:hypothetical protein M0D69_34065, partial [Caballeronia sp. SEWSISQ10-4 2]|uniref:hypothetical protein n=1 Tax=Caballeronia sp. SEWSISQ10-4 2 TaxID=2937438 RepID=UPI00264C091D